MKRVTVQFATSDNSPVKKITGELIKKSKSGGVTIRVSDNKVVTVSGLGGGQVKSVTTGKDGVKRSYHLGYASHVPENHEELLKATHNVVTEV